MIPVGVGVRAIQDLSHFDNDGLVQGIAILAGWTVLCTGLVFWRDIPARRPTATSLTTRKSYRSTDTSTA